MIIPDEGRAKRKLAQIGYYRLSDFWYPCRKGKVDEHGKYITDPLSGLPVREDAFQEGTDFNLIIDLYLFDKKLRQLMMDAIERIEIHVRSVIAYEIGRFDPLAYQNTDFINPKILRDKTDRSGRIVNYWNDWISRQDKICQRLEVPNKKILRGWLQEINELRNHCAHHSRIWNRVSNNALKTLPNEFFHPLSLSLEARKRIFGKICVLWFLVKKIGPNSQWILNVADLIDSKPQLDCCPFTSMGFKDNNGFHRDLFNL
jgi:abortive infection bacteriophage resistance protein